MSVATDAVFEIPEDGDNTGPRHDDPDAGQAFVDEDNVPHPGGPEGSGPDDRSREGSGAAGSAADAPPVS